ncbi:hypothetical protein VVT58_12610 [Sphingobium sp. SJ10-10]|uniref:hypothetical protein n=1 Tax=Sphingobium sp. SJ10-10 TaxID=3114999 RepID=UPI00332687D8
MVSNIRNNSGSDRPGFFGGIAQLLRYRTLNHTLPPAATPYVRARAKSQAFRQNRAEPCDFDYFKITKNHASLRVSPFFTADDQGDRA